MVLSRGDEDIISPPPLFQARRSGSRGVGVGSTLVAACGGVAVASRLRNGGCAVAFPARRTQTTARRMPSLRCSASNTANRVLRMRIMNVLRIRFRVLRIRTRAAATQITCRLQVMWQQKGALALPAVWVSLAMGAMAFLVASFFCWRLTFCRRLVRYGRHGRRSQGTSAFVHVVAVSLRGCACACARPCARLRGGKCLV